MIIRQALPIPLMILDFPPKAKAFAKRAKVKRVEES
jgi:hypothetical protein